jgi:hypothetical protein
MCQHSRTTQAYNGRLRTNVVVALVGEDYAPSGPYSDTALIQGSADRLRLIWKAGIDQRGAIFLINDQGKVEEAHGFLWIPRYRQDIHTVSNPHRSPLRPFF